MASLLVLTALTTTSAGSGAAVAHAVRVLSGTSLLRGVACPSATDCIAVGEVGGQQHGAVVDLGQTTPAVQEPTNTNELDGVACWSASHCVAVGVGNTASDGYVVPIVNAVQTGAQDVTGTGYLHSVGCMSNGTCVAVGWEYCSTACNGNNNIYGVVVPIVGGSAAAVEKIPGTLSLYGVGCFDTFCLAAGTDNAGKGAVVPISNGTAGGEVDVSSSGPLQAAACATAATCVAVGALASDGTKGVVVSTHDGALGASEDMPGGGSLWGVACPTESKCWVSGNGGDAGLKGGIADLEVGSELDPLHPESGTSRLYAVTCTAEYSCVAAGQGPPLGSGPGVVDSFGAVEGAWKARDVAAAKHDLPVAVKNAITYCTPHALGLVGFGTGVLLIGSAGALAVAGLLTAYATAPFCLATIKRVLTDWKRAHDPPDPNYHQVANVARVVLPQVPSCARWTGALNTFCLQLRSDSLKWSAAAGRVASIGQALALTQDRESAALAASDQAAANLQDAQIPRLEKQQRAPVAAMIAAGEAMGQLLKAHQIGYRMTAVQSRQIIAALERTLTRQHVTVADVKQLDPTGLTPRAIDILQALLTA